MKQIMCVAPGNLRMTEVPVPVVRPDEILIRIRRIGICGTDLHAYDGTQPYFTYPRVLGHEISGEVVETGSLARNFKTGEKVTLMPYLACHSCIACRNGKTNCCVNMRVAGVHVDGGMSEYISVPALNVLHGGDLTLCNLALVEPLAIGAHALRLAGAREGETVLVAGAGPIGMTVAAIARAGGAKVVSMDINTGRLDFIRQHFGIEHTINALDHPLEHLKVITGGEFAPVVIDATGSLKAIETGLDYLSHGGRYILVGLQREAFSFSHPDFHQRETLLQSSRNAIPEDFDTVISLIKSGKIDPSPMITHRILFNDLPDEINRLTDPVSGLVKALVFID